LPSVFWRGKLASLSFLSLASLSSSILFSSLLFLVFFQEIEQRKNKGRSQGKRSGEESGKRSEKEKGKKREKEEKHIKKADLRKETDGGSGTDKEKQKRKGIR
jgi:predicted transposase YdaD